MGRYIVHFSNFCLLTAQGADWDLLSPFELEGLSYYQNIRVKPGLLQLLINYFDPLNKLFRHNVFEICPLFKELSIIYGRIPMVEEIPTVPRLDIDPASLILLVYSFSAFEIQSYHFGANVVPLQPFIERAMSIYRTSPWPSLFSFWLLSQYLLLSDIDVYGSLRLVPIVE
ncbi:hypothetical protein JCGZ_19715 [Jatropha curcas]|uniref:Uncharacterized protein n=1 Tax=Jatropha curcas TaxID=180498 RepID=A0A067JYZ3_JATCU|nr:hypothetical protein JCGZ_19715 [Jatropha curcas]